MDSGGRPLTLSCGERKRIDVMFGSMTPPTPRNDHLLEWLGPRQKTAVAVAAATNVPVVVTPTTGLGDLGWVPDPCGGPEAVGCSDPDDILWPNSNRKNGSHVRSGSTPLKLAVKSTSRARKPANLIRFDDHEHVSVRWRAIRSCRHTCHRTQASVAVNYEWATPDRHDAH